MNCSFLISPSLISECINKLLFAIPILMREKDLYLLYEIIRDRYTHRHFMFLVKDRNGNSLKQCLSELYFFFIKNLDYCLNRYHNV